MKKIFSVALVVLVALTGLVALQSHREAEKTAAPMADISFKTITPTTSGSNKAATINNWNYTAANYYIETNDSLTLTLDNVKNGGAYCLLIKKTVSGVCTLTFSGTVVGTTSPISLSGSTNSYFWINYTKVGSTVVLLKQ